MSEIIEYHVIAESYINVDSFNEKVNELIKEGYEPLGGVSTLRDGINWHLSQAMIKRSNK